LQDTTTAPLTNSCGTTLCRAALVYCPSDFNRDWTIDFFDYLDCVAAFSTGTSESDFNSGLVVDFFDYLDFVEAFSFGL
jgi:hypothetical protein